MPRRIKCASTGDLTYRTFNHSESRATFIGRKLNPRCYHVLMPPFCWVTAMRFPIRRVGVVTSPISAESSPHVMCPSMPDCMSPFNAATASGYLFTYHPLVNLMWLTHSVNTSSTTTQLAMLHLLQLPPLTLIPLLQSARPHLYIRCVNVAIRYLQLPHVQSPDP